MISISIDAVSAHTVFLLGLPVDDFMWTAYTVAYTDLAAAAATNSITLAALPAKTVLHAACIKHDTSFTGGALSNYTLSVGLVGTVDKYASPFNVFQATGASVGQLSGALFCENFTAPTNVLVTGTAVGALLNAATAGSATIWLCTTTLP